MLKMSRGFSALVLGSALAASAFAQPPLPPVVPPVTPPPAKPEVRPTGNAAVVNNQAIPEVAVYRALRSFPEAHKEMARKEILSHLIENALIDQYLNALKITVEEKDVDKLIADLKKELSEAKDPLSGKPAPKDYLKELEAMMLTEAEFRVEVAAQMKWEKFVEKQGTPEALKQLFDSSPDVFDGTMVRARHVLMTPGTDEAKQKEAAGTLRGIKQVVEQEAAKAVAALPATADALQKEQAKANKTDELFAAYATKYSVCPSKKDGGDLNFFPRAGAMVEPFAKAAFALKPYEMSDVVATEFGYHLILVTQRRQGTQKKFEEVKDDVKILYAMRIREAVIAQMKPKAAITITPAAGIAPK